MDFLSKLLSLMTEQGTGKYGEEVTQLEHSLQAATLAQEAGASNALIAACLLHDVGHMLPHGGRRKSDGNDLHELKGADYLDPWFPSEVVMPIRLHVPAKRYLCATVEGYYDTLSPISKHTLALQGGPFTAKTAKEFIELPNAPAAVKVRQWDDAAKVPSRETPPLEHFRPLLEALVRPQWRTALRTGALEHREQRV